MKFQETHQKQNSPVMLKPWLLVLPVLVVLVLAAALIERTATSVPSSITSSTPTNTGGLATQDNWKLYINETHRYEVSYPYSATLKVDDQGGVSILFVELFLGEDGSEGNSKFGISITVHDNPEQLTVQQWALKGWESDLILKSETVTIGGVEGYKIKIFQFDGASYYIYLPREDQIYTISLDDTSSPSLILSESLQKHYNELFRRIVGSFKFR